MITQIDVFDFDGTLFNSPKDTLENQRLYELNTGIPWVITEEIAKVLLEKTGKVFGPRKGWWGRHETLEPPLVPSPVPVELFNTKVLCDLEASKINNNSVTLLLTGRPVHLRAHIENICNQVKIIDENLQVFLLGDNGPCPFGKKPKNTFDWKSWIIEQFVRLNQNVNKLAVWEDRVEHVTKFEELQGKLVEEVVVNHVAQLDFRSQDS